VIKQRVLEITHRWSPTHVICDFEKAVRTALTREVRTPRIRGCYFHVKQSLWRKVQELGLVPAYKNQRRVEKIIRRVMAIGFLPTAVVALNFQELLNHEPRTQRAIRRHPNLRRWFMYVDRTYIMDRSDFPVPTWNAFDRDMDVRTNNHMEGEYSINMFQSHSFRWAHVVIA
jgi:hypothetical protein